MRLNQLKTTLREPLVKALSFKRASGSAEEAKLRTWLVKRHIENLDMIDESGNVWFSVGESKTLFAAHTDTVHLSAGFNLFSESDGFVLAADECLGADDGAGVALLSHMISNNVAGTYLFTTGEEVGGVGAKHIAQNLGCILRKFDRAICFDRAGVSEIVTVQGGERCASSEFAEALSVALSDQGLLYSEAVNGVYTDNKEWAGHVSECVNLSCGYGLQHSVREFLDLGHFAELADAVCLVNWEALPVKRDPAEKEDLWAGWAQYGVTSKIGLSLVEEPKDLGAEEAKLMRALTSALVEDNLAPVLQQVRELLNDYDNVYKSSTLSENLLDDCITALLGGFTAYDVALDLQEILING